MSSRFFVPFKSESFPPRFGNRSGVLTFTASDLAHSLFVTGRAPGDQKLFGDASVWEWIHRSSLIPAYVRRSPAGRLFRSDLALTLDRSEKVALSYALGQAMTGVFCRQVLGVPLLLHVDRYQSRWRVDLGGSRKRPDLFGRLGPAAWVVAEAKGRSNAAEASLGTALVAQKNVIKTVAGHKPVVLMGCVASFPAPAPGIVGSMRVDAVDPEPDPEGDEVEIDEARYLVAYYEPFIRAVEGGIGVPDSRDGGSRALGNGVTVGLREDLYEVLTSLEGSDLVNAYDSLDLVPSNEQAELGWRSDGTQVTTNWEPSFVLGDVTYER